MASSSWPGSVSRVHDPRTAATACDHRGRRRHRVLLDPDRWSDRARAMGDRGRGAHETGGARGAPGLVRRIGRVDDPGRFLRRSPGVALCARRLPWAGRRSRAHDASDDPAAGRARRAREPARGRADAQPAPPRHLGGRPRRATRPLSPARLMLHAEVGLQLGTLALDATLDAKAGEIVVLLGPNGAGKTTLLRAIAGLTPLARGEVTLDGAVLDDVARGVHVPAERRPIGVVFQEYLLFPHQTVAENVGFGLRARGVDRVHARARALEWLDRFELAAYADAHPRSLSGGQAQRVALARALAYTPRLLLHDEPLAALDASARGEVRRDLKRHLASFDGIRVLITHDPLEAIALADRLGIRVEGRAVHAGTPSDVTQRPRTRYVADLVGVNLFRGRAKGGLISLESGSTLQSAEELDGDVFALIHPRAVALHRHRPEGSPRNVWRGRTRSLDLQGDRVRVAVDGELAIVAEVTPAAIRDLALAQGGEVWVSVKATEISVYHA